MPGPAPCPRCSSRRGGRVPPLTLLQKKTNNKNLARPPPGPYAAVPERETEGRVTPPPKPLRARGGEGRPPGAAPHRAPTSAPRAAGRDGHPQPQPGGTRRGDEAGAGRRGGGHGFRVQRTGHGGKSGGDLGVLPCDSLERLCLDPGQQLLDELLHRQHLLRAQSPVCGAAQGVGLSRPLRGSEPPHAPRSPVPSARPRH